MNIKKLRANGGFSNKAKKITQGYLVLIELNWRRALYGESFVSWACFLRKQKNIQVKKNTNKAAQNKIKITARGGDRGDNEGYFFWWRLGCFSLLETLQYIPNPYFLKRLLSIYA